MQSSHIFHEEDWLCWFRNYLTASSRPIKLALADVEALCVYFKQIQALQKNWIEAGRMGFVTEDIHGVNQYQFELLQQELDESWTWELGGETKMKQWVAFLRCLSLQHRLLASGKEGSGPSPSFQ